jgi:hypothetical protein
MTLAREAFGLPLMFLTVTLLGGLRPAGLPRLMPPPLIALVLGCLLMAALVRARVIVLSDFVRSGRSALENASGLTVVIALAAATVQIFTLLLPERGLLHVLFATFFFVQLVSSLAAVDEPRPLLRSLLVLLGAAFVLRFIVLEALYAPEGGTLTRVLTVLLEGVSLGALQYEPVGGTMGYLAFAALVLYLTALYLLRPGDRTTTGMLVRQTAVPDVRP